MKYAWIDGARDTYPLAVLCRVLSVSTSGFADWKSCDGPTQWLSDEQLLALIRSIHTEVKGSYGSPRMFEELKARGFPASKGRVRRLMQAHGIRGRHKRRYKATTNSRHKLPVAGNLLDRQFDTASPDQVWTVDITYIQTGEGWLASRIWLGHWCPTCAKRKPRLTMGDLQRSAARNGGRCLSEAYSDKRQKLMWECHRGHVWLARVGNIRAGKWCPNCAILARTKKASNARNTMSRDDGGLQTEVVTRRQRRGVADQDTAARDIEAPGQSVAEPAG